jgi:Ankyrin repeats (3 copies)/Ankyrin repeats (many copies)
MLCVYLFDAHIAAEKKRRGTETRNRLVNTEQPSTVISDDLTISMSLPLENPTNGLAETLFDSHTADQLLYQGTQDISFPTPDMSQLVHPTLEEVTSWDLGPWNALSSPENVNLSQSSEEQRPPSQPRSSDSDMSPTNSDADDKSMSRLITKVNDEKGWISGLHIAAQTGNEQIVRVLLSSGNIDVNQQDSDDRTPLLHAVMQNHESVVRVLLKHGAQIGILDCDGRSGIQWAILRRNLTILQLLLEHRAEYEQDLDIDSSDNTGWTALHMAIVRSFEPAVPLLIQLGANINAKAHKCPFQERSR